MLGWGMGFLRLFRELTSVPTAPFFEGAVSKRALAWIRSELGRSVDVTRHRGGILARYRGAGTGPALALAAHLDHPAFHLSRVTREGASARLMGGLPKELLPGAAVEAFPALPRDNRPAASGTLGEPAGDDYPVTWKSPPPSGVNPEFAALALPACFVQGYWLASRSIDDLLGCAISLEALKRACRARLKTNLTVLLHRAEEVGFIGALEFIRGGVLSQADSVLSVETSRRLPRAVPGRGPVIRTGDRAVLFDPNLLRLLDDSAEALGRSGLRCQRARLTGGSCEATAYLTFGYETAGVAVPLVNYHNGGRRKVEPEKVRLEDAEGCVRLLLEAAKRFPSHASRGLWRERLNSRRRALAHLL